jgi:hypothetical protein
MGADCYIKSIYNKYNKKIQNLICIKNDDDDDIEIDSFIIDDEIDRINNFIEGYCYFRDSYNGSNLLNHIGMSWDKDIEKLLTKSGFMKLENQIKLKEKLYKLLPLENIFFNSRLELFLSLLRNAIYINEKIYVYY